MTQHPRSIRQLVDEAHDYEYIPSVALKIYLKTADTLNRHADLYNDAKSYDDAYIFYIRFLDLLMNKIPTHPQLKEDPVLYKAYLKLVNDKAPLAFKRAEAVKHVLNEHLEAHAKYVKVLEENEKKRVALEKLKQERMERSQTDEVDDAHDGDDDDEEDTELVDQALSDLLKNTEANHLPSTAYPQLPEHHDISVTSTAQPPQLPAKTDPASRLSRLSQNLHLTPTSPEHKTIASTESGKPLKTVYLPTELETKFLSIAQHNTDKRLETCGILCGKLSLNAFFITALVIPEQESTENTCQTSDEESLLEYVSEKDLFVLGWIHTHPTQSCFLSSVDLHTHNSYQIMLPEAVAIVCAPSAHPNWGVFRLTDPPGVGIVTKCHRSGFHPHDEANIYKKCEKRFGGHVVIKNGLPFTCMDLRKTK